MQWQTNLPRTPDKSSGEHGNQFRRQALKAVKIFEKTILQFGCNVGHIHPLIALGAGRMLNSAAGVVIGVLLGFAMVWWVRPDTSAGTVIIIVTTTLICFAVSLIATLIGKVFRRS